MTGASPHAFIAKWERNLRAERSAAQEHFIDLCAVLEQPTPNTDPDGTTYAFEKGAVKASGRPGWADVWKRGCFAWEYKGKFKDLDAAHQQLLQYAGALENPPLLITCDIARIVIRTNYTNEVSVRHDILLGDIWEPANLALLRAVFTEGSEVLRTRRTREAVTRDAAEQFAALALRLRERGHDPQRVAHFVIRLVFCLFAVDVDLLPKRLFAELLDEGVRRPDRFAGDAALLFAAMAQRDARVGLTRINWFNGGLFDDDDALPLEKADVELLRRAATLDWAEIDPSIMGTLFERGLDPDKRSQLGAHYTSRDMIEKIIDPVIRRPLRAEWQTVLTEIAELLAAAKAAKPGSKARREAPKQADAAFHTFIDRLRAFRVLDPACGSGNFLYLSLLALKELEHEAMMQAETMGLQREFPRVGPEAVLGIEINPYAAELARVSVWIGHIQWARRHGYAPDVDPVLRTLDTIECRDAILAPDGTAAAWPAVDVIVGNPPFLGTKKQFDVLGTTYSTRLRSAYAGRIPAFSDLVAYWFEQARDQICKHRALRAGLVATNSLRGGTGRQVLDHIAETSRFSDVWSDEAWTLEGAAVRVSIICFERKAETSLVRLNGQLVQAINPDLTSAVDLTLARKLEANAATAFIGTVKGGPFEVPGMLARDWLEQPSNPNGLLNSGVLRPWVNSLDVVRRPNDIWIVDFGTSMSEREAAFFGGPFGHVRARVRPHRQTVRNPPERERWWIFSRALPALRTALAKSNRFIATPTVSKHRVFVWLDSRVQPDHQLVAFARDDDTTFGILHSRIHELWALRLGTSLEDRPRYTPSTTFETFPFPEHLTPDRAAASYEADPHARAVANAARTLVAARDAWLNPPELVRQVPEVVPGYPDRLLPVDETAAKILKKRTLTNLYNTRGSPGGAWLDALHRNLDAAVTAAYGWPADLSDDDMLARLLKLNLDRAAKQEPRPRR